MGPASGRWPRPAGLSASGTKMDVIRVMVLPGWGLGMESRFKFEPAGLVCRRPASRGRGSSGRRTVTGEGRGRHGSVHPRRTRIGIGRAPQETVPP